MEELSIKVSIANREYPLKINISEEDAVRRAADIVNARIKTLLDNYAVRDKQDLLAMCALQFATESLKDGSDGNASIHKMILDMDHLLDEALLG
jgi:cell division protein ZapA